MKKTLILSFFIIAGYFLNAQNPCPYKYGANEVDSLKCLEEITTFRTFYDQRNYNDAYTSWQYLVNHCPCSWNGIFVYSQTMFDNLIKSSQDSLQRERYIDSLLWSYEVRHQFFPNNYTEGNGLGFKAYNTMRYRTNDYENALNWFTRSIDMEKEKSQPSILDIYFKTAEIMVKVKRDTTIIIDAYERATEYIDEAINNAYKQYEKQLPNLVNLDSAFKMGQINELEYDKRLKVLSEDTSRQMKLVSNYQKTLNNIEVTFMPYAPCSVLEQVYSKKLESNRDNMSVVKKIVMTMSKNPDQECLNTKVFRDALELLHNEEPGAQSAYLMGNFSLRNNEIDKAIAYFQQAIELFETNEQKVNPYYMMALAYQLKGSYSEARNAANNVIRIKPNHGKAYILIGDLYSLSASTCANAGVMPYSTSWAAADKYNRAAAVDPSVAEEAASKRAKLTYPSITDKHARGLNNGESYRVGCWIQENTTVR